MFSIVELAEYVCKGVSQGLFNLTPLILFLQIVSKKRKHSDIPITFIFSTFIHYVVQVPFLSGMINQIIGYSAAGICILWAILYSLCFSISIKKINVFFFLLIVTLNFAFEFYIVVGIFIMKRYLTEEKILRWIFNGLTLIDSLTTGQNLIIVIKTGKYQQLPIGTCFIGAISSILWLVYYFVFDTISFKEKWDCYTTYSLTLIIFIIEIIVFYGNYMRYKDRGLKVEPINEDERTINADLSRTQSLISGQENV